MLGVDLESFDDFAVELDKLSSRLRTAAGQARCVTSACRLVVHKGSGALVMDGRTLTWSPRRWTVRSRIVTLKGEMSQTVNVKYAKRDFSCRRHFTILALLGVEFADI